MNFSQLAPARRALSALSAVAFLTAFSVLAFALQWPPTTSTRFAATPETANPDRVFTAPGLNAPVPNQPAPPVPAGSTPGAPNAQLPPMPLPPGQTPPAGSLPPGQMLPGQLSPGQLPPGPVPANMQGDPKLAALFQKALDAQRKGDLKSAASSYRALLRQNPDAMPAHLNLALVLLQQKDNKQATWHLKKAIAIAPTSTQPRVLLAQAYMQQKKPREAYEQWTQLADLKLPDGGQAAFTAGAIAFEELKKPADAERWLRRANEQSKGADPRVALLLAKALSAQKKYAQANAVLEPVAKKFSKSIEIQAALADAQWQSGAKTKAIATLRALEASTPGTDGDGLPLSQVRLMLGRALADQKQYDEAIEVFKKSLDGLPAKSPAIASTKALLAQTFAAQAEAEEKSGRVDGALAAWNEAAKIFPDNPTAFVQRGRLLEKQNKNSQALQEYNRALKMLPREASVLEATAKLEEKTGDPNRAMTRWKTIIETRPEYSPAYSNLARIAANQKQFAAQMDYLETQLKKNPDRRAPYDAVLEAGRNAGRSELARDWVSQMAKKYPKAKAPRNALIAFDRKYPRPKAEKIPVEKAPAPKPKSKPTPTQKSPSTPAPNPSTSASPAPSTPTVKTSPKITPPIIKDATLEKPVEPKSEDVDNSSSTPSPKP
jgi:tetratricopeptide (TPR) repeat protein